MRLMKYLQVQLSKCCHFHYVQNIRKKFKKYALKQLPKEEHIKKQIGNIIRLPLVPKKKK